MLRPSTCTQYPTPSRVTLEHVRLFVRRREHSGVALSSVTELLECLAAQAPVSEIEELISRDVHLAMRVVKLAGTAGFGGRKVQSIKHAVELIGYDQLRSVVGTASYLSHAKKRLIGPGLCAERFQRRSLLMGLLCRVLADRLDLPDVETHFMAGMLQDCGYLPIARLLPERLEQVVAVLSRTPVNDISELEQYYLGFTHTQVGRILGEEYNFCDHMLEAISHHHWPMFANESSQSYADLAHLSSWIADQLGLVVFDHIRPQVLDKYTARRLGIDTEDLLATLGAVHQAARETYDAFSA